MCIFATLHLQEVHKNARVAALHSAAEVFDPRTEHVYKYLQVGSGVISEVNMSAVERTCRWGSTTHLFCFAVHA
jgi:hypothetical protein